MCIYIYIYMHIYIYVCEDYVNITRVLSVWLNECAQCLTNEKKKWCLI